MILHLTWTPPPESSSLFRILHQALEDELVESKDEENETDVAVVEDMAALESAQFDLKKASGQLLHTITTRTELSELKSRLQSTVEKLVGMISAKEVDEK